MCEQISRNICQQKGQLKAVKKSSKRADEVVGELIEIEDCLAEYKYDTEYKIQRVKDYLLRLEFLKHRHKEKSLPTDREDYLWSLLDKMHAQCENYKTCWLEYHMDIFKEEEKFPVPDDEAVYLKLSDELEDVMDTVMNVHGEACEYL